MELVTPNNLSRIISGSVANGVGAGKATKQMMPYVDNVRKNENANPRLR